MLNHPSQTQISKFSTFMKYSAWVTGFMLCSQHIKFFYYMADWFCILWLINFRSISIHMDLNSSSWSLVKTSNNFVLFPKWLTKPYNKHLISLVCSVCMANYGSSRLGHKKKEKSLVHNLLYGSNNRYRYVIQATSFLPNTTKNVAFD